LVSVDTRGKVLTTGEAIRFLKISKPTYLKYIRMGRIRAVRAGNGWRVLHSELHRFLRGGKNKEEDSGLADEGRRSSAGA
jgi:excisionase family DNA binding protein